MSQVVQDRYRIDRLLARGGMGAVYSARDLWIDRDVALKIVRPELVGDPERFEREMQIVASLRHPSVAAVFDHGMLADGGAFVAMQLVDGEDLRHLLLREGQLRADRTLRILRDVCAGVDAAHREGLVHRDLKPENILLPSKGAAAIVLDFGLASIFQESRRGGTVIIGTPAYMAPDQLRGAEPDARSDIFSLGVIAFEMLTGELPFGRGSLAEIVLAQARGPAVWRDALPASLEHAVTAALQMDAYERPPTARAFAQLLAS